MTTLRLLWIHVFAWGAVWLTSYWTGLEYLAAGLYLFIIGLEANSLSSLKWPKRLFTALAWQIPGYILAVIQLTGWNPGGIYYYAIFLLEFWMTPILPWLALLPPSGLAYPSYYYGLIAGAPFLSLWIWIGSGKINPLAVYKHSRFGSAKVSLPYLPAVFKETDSYINKTYPFFRGLLICGNCRFLIILCAKRTNIYCKIVEISMKEGNAMPEQKLVLVEKSQGTCWITMNRPEALNALTPEMINGVKEAVLEADRAADIGVTVITGTGRAWCTGLDLKALGQIEFVGGAVGEEIDEYGRSFIAAVQNCTKPVIAMVNGFVFTGGLELLLSTDIVIAAEEACFGDTHCKFGIRPSWGMSQRLPRIIGINRAKYYTFTARTMTAKEAFDYGLVSAVVPLDRLRAEVEDVCQAILKNSPQAIAACKAMYNQGWLTTLQDGLENVEYQQNFEIEDTNQRLAKFIR